MSDPITTIEHHFVTFFSPGTFVAETTVLPVDSWNIEAACEMARSIRERHSATPYAFRFTTRGRADDDLDSHQTAQSGFYYLGGKVETLEEIEARNDPAENILRSKMRANGFSRVIVNTNSWRWTQPLEENDVVLDWRPSYQPSEEPR